jgi:hypothetical protein
MNDAFMGPRARKRYVAQKDQEIRFGRDLHRGMRGLQILDEQRHIHAIANKLSDPRERLAFLMSYSKFRAIGLNSPNPMR